MTSLAAPTGEGVPVEPNRSGSGDGRDREQSPAPVPTKTPNQGCTDEGGDVEGDAILSAAGLPGESGEGVGDGAHSHDVGASLAGCVSRHAEVRAGAVPALTAPVPTDIDHQADADYDCYAELTPAQARRVRAWFDRRATGDPDWCPPQGIPRPDGAA